MTPEEIAWAAGIFEGEGCIARSDSATGIRLKVVMCDRDIVERFYKLVGVGTFTAVARPNSPAHHRPQWQWFCGGRKETRELLETLWPWLGDRRRARATELLAEVDHVLRERPCPNCGHTFQPTYAKQGRRFCSRTCSQDWFKRNGRAPAQAIAGQLSL